MARTVGCYASHAVSELPWYEKQIYSIKHSVSLSMSLSSKCLLEALMMMFVLISCPGGPPFYVLITTFGWSNFQTWRNLTRLDLPPKCQSSTILVLSALVIVLSHDGSWELPHRDWLPRDRIHTLTVSNLKMRTLVPRALRVRVN